jgi:hypothetical protein
MPLERRSLGSYERLIMPKFTKTVSGASEQELQKRLDPVFPAVDRGRELLADRAAALEQAHLRGATREVSRIAHKYGRDSTQARTAAEAVRSAERRLVAITLEVERTRIGAVRPDPAGVVIHGRVLDTTRGGQPNLTVAVVEPGGNQLVATKSDERGYFKLESQPLVEPAGGLVAGGDTAARDTAPARRAAARRRTRLVVLDGKREVHSEDLEKLEAGQARYREIVLKAR